MSRASTLLAVVLTLLCAADGHEARSFTGPPDHPPAHQDIRHAVETLLQATAAYVAQYERELTSVVAEEDYIQRLGASRGAPSRHLRSDLLFILDEHYGYMGFRDVFEVDGRPVRNREERLANLFLKPRGKPFERARRIAEESARYNLNHDRIRIQRTINMPFTALKFLRAPNQPRSAFRIDERLTAKGGTAGDIALAFTEQARPPLIESPDKLPARGAFWIDPGSGRVSRSELTVRTGSTTIRIQVAYTEDTRFGMWLPSSMEEEYLIAAGARIEGSAQYSNFRRFRVETDTEIGGP